MLFDSHAHLLDNRFRSDLNEVLNGAGGMICMYSPGEDIEIFKSLLDKDFIWGAAGIHPHDAKNAGQMWDELERALNLNKVMAVGEIGLDFYYDHSPRDIQQEVFEKQLRLAEKVNLPVVIHTRDAFEGTIEILRLSKVKDALIHCFPGNVQQMKDLIDRGYYIAVGGVVTFPKAQQLKEVVKEVPLNRLLLETDCPYLAPQPVRGKRNQPSYLKYIAEEVANIKNIDTDEVTRIICENTLKFFRISG